MLEDVTALKKWINNNNLDVFKDKTKRMQRSQKHIFIDYRSNTFT